MQSIVLSEISWISEENQEFNDFFVFLMIPQTGVLILQRRLSSMLIPIYSWYTTTKEIFLCSILMFNPVPQC